MRRSQAFLIGLVFCFAMAFTAGQLQAGTTITPNDLLAFTVHYGAPATFTTLAASDQPSPSPSPVQATITVPRGTIVAVLVTKDIRIGGFGNSTEAKKVDFEVAQDVVVDGHLVLQTGDLVEGHYTNQRNETKRLFSTNVSQELALDVDDAVNYCGDTIHLQFERTYVGGGRVGIGSFGPHAHDAVFEKGIVLKAKTDRLQRDICADVTTEQPPIPFMMVVPDDEVTPIP